MELPLTGENLRIVFMGSPEFAVPSLEKIISSSHKIVGIVTQPDKIRGRGKKSLPTAVKEFALKNDISPVLQPVSLKDEHFLNELKKTKADIFVVVAFRILPPSVFSLPVYGTINLHPSLLPKYRGAAPLNWAIIQGEKETGMTIMKIAQAVDAGGILLQEKCEILPDETFGSLHDRLSYRGAELLLQVLNRIAEGPVFPQTQDDTQATPAPKITREMCHLNFDQPAEKVKNWIHGLSPKPGGFSYYRGARIKFLKAKIAATGSLSAVAGTITKISNRQIEVACSPGAIEILELQREGKRMLPTVEFLRGFPFREGERFE